MLLGWFRAEPGLNDKVLVQIRVLMGAIES
jgi:hypothetical protein